MSITNRILFGTDYPLYTSQEYISILKQKIGLNAQEIEAILMQKKN